ncbi:MAG: DUF4956 domain-containing protein [Lachnospiraceae bacterium]|nr:DUF4956 domain-containing protein [Lachnospiraceae bacterium]
MLDTILNTETGVMDIQTAMICTVASLVLGLVIASFYMIQEKRFSKSYVTTLALLPALIQVVIMLVNGNLGTGVAVMGAFSLIRFRSVPGTAKEIATIFFAMVVGLATGTGYVTYAVIFTVIIGVAMLILTKSSFGEMKDVEKNLKITIPENLDYNGLFDDLFEAYTNKHELYFVKTTNLGSMYELQYHIELKNMEQEKKFIDSLRCRNGNLTIVCERKGNRMEEL